MFYKFGVTFCVVAICLVGLVYGFSDCGSTDGAIISVSVPGCDTTKRCDLKRGTNASFDLTFTTNVDSSEINAIVHGVVLGIPMPFNLPNPNGCNDCGIACPIKAGETYKYNTELPVLIDYPKVSVDVKWELQTEDKKDIICALIPVRLV